jgi:hypothetical protein
LKRERPVAVLALALSGVLVGGLGLAGAAAVLAIGRTFAGPEAPAVIVPLAPAAAYHCRVVVPGFRALEVLLPAGALLGSALVLASGLALLSLRRGARAVARVTAAAVLGVLLVTALYEFAVLLPAVESWREEGFRHNLAPRPPVSDLMPAELQWVALLPLLGGLLFFVHAVATLVVLSAPAIAEAFAPRPADKGGEAPCPRDCSTATG